MATTQERTLIALGGDVDEEGLPVGALCRARALYDCEPDEAVSGGGVGRRRPSVGASSRPRVARQGDLKFSVGDIITVLGKDEKSQVGGGGGGGG